MNNQELEVRVKEILAIENFFDMIEATVAFEKEYKGSDFFKHTKMPLKDVIKNSKLWYSLRLEGLARNVQSFIDNLDLTNIGSVLDKIGEVYGQENEEISVLLKEFKDMVF